jgi:hypothetical protein
MSLQFETAAAPPNAELQAFVAAYRPPHGVFDEMMDVDGRVRAHWQPFLATLAALGSDEINRRFAAADRYLRDSGVFYRVYEDSAGIERPWPLSHVPLVIEPGEWRQLEAGLIQRAELLEAVLADSYGPGTLTRDGRVPAALIAVDTSLDSVPSSTPAWEAVREEAFATSDIGPLSPAHFVFPSRMVSLDPEIRDYVRQSFSPGRAILDAATELIRRIKADMIYEIGATTVTTTPPMSFALRRGVCQDFVHDFRAARHRSARRLCQRLSASVRGGGQQIDVSVNVTPAN